MSSGHKIFISATSADLAPMREIVKQGLLTLSFHPVEQKNFPPDYRSLKDSLREKIKGCDALIHIVGRRFGFEPDPQQLPAGEPRRSYTQLEYEAACELGIKVYTFICGDEFPYADTDDPPESVDKVKLQHLHRERLLSDQNRFHQPVANESELEIKIRELQVSLNEIGERHEKHRKRMLIGILAASFVLLFVVGSSLWAILKAQTQTAKAISDAKKETTQALSEVASKVSTEKVHTLQELRLSWKRIEPDFYEFTDRIHKKVNPFSLDRASDIPQLVGPVFNQVRDRMQEIKQYSIAITDITTRQKVLAGLDAMAKRTDELEAEILKTGVLGKKWDDHMSAIKTVGGDGFQTEFEQSYLRGKKLEQERDQLATKYTELLQGWWDTYSNEFYTAITAALADASTANGRP